MVLLWSCISVPLCLLGTVVGRNWAGHPDNPCRVKRIPSPIPQKQVHTIWCPLSLHAGALCSQSTHAQHLRLCEHDAHAYTCCCCIGSDSTRAFCPQWYLRPWAIALMGGVLPFGSIFIEVRSCCSMAPADFICCM